MVETASNEESPGERHHRYGIKRWGDGVITPHPSIQALANGGGVSNQRMGSSSEEQVWVEKGENSFGLRWMRGRERYECYGSGGNTRQ